MAFQEYNCKLVSPEQRLSDIPIKTPYDAVKFMADQIYDDCTEKIYAILFAPDLKPIGFFQLAEGDETLCICSPAQLVRICALSNATSVCIIHNHPCTSQPEPSEQDDETIYKFKDALELINVQLTDNVIVNQCNSMYSYLNHNRPPFQDALTNLSEEEFAYKHSFNNTDL